MWLVLSYPIQIVAFTWMSPGAGLPLEKTKKNMTMASGNQSVKGSQKSCQFLLMKQLMNNFPNYGQRSGPCLDSHFQKSLPSGSGLEPPPPPSKARESSLHKKELRPNVHRAANTLCRATAASHSVRGFPLKQVCDTGNVGWQDVTINWGCPVASSQSARRAERTIPELVGQAKKLAGVLGLVLIDLAFVVKLRAYEY